MSNKRVKKKGVTVLEFLEQAADDPEYIRKVAAWELASQAAVIEYRKAAAGLLAELADHGFELRGIGDLRRSRKPYRKVLPILAHWLPLIDNVRVKQDIVHALAVKGGESYAAMLIDEFDKAPPGSLRWSIGNAIGDLRAEAAVTEMIRIATDVRLGRDREMVVLGLGRLKDPRVVPVLRRLLTDADAVAVAASALAKLGATEALPELRTALVSVSKPLKTGLKTAIAKLERKLH